MKTTININLSSFVFDLEEDAYQLLSNYLRSIEQRFLDSNEAAEIIADVESRIAEHFTQVKQTENRPIQKGDVDAIIAILGQPEDFGEPSTGTSEATGDTTQGKYGNYRRMYRDADRSKIAGVCGGLGAYFGIDPIIFRVLFIVSIFVAGSGIVIYLLLWFVVPAARTTAQKLEMRGERVTINNIERTVKEEFNNVKQNFKQFKNSPQAERFRSETRTVAEKFVREIKPVFGAVGRVLGILFGIFFAFIGLILFIALISTIFIGNGVVSVGLPLGVGVPDILAIFTEPDSANYLFVGLLIMLGVMFLSMLVSGLRLIFRFKTHTLWQRWAASGLWVVGLIMFLVGVHSSTKHFFKETEHQQVYELRPINGNQWRIEAAEIDTVLNVKRMSHWKDNVFAYRDKDLYLLIPPHLQIEPSTNGKAELVVLCEANGETKEEAEINAKNTKYHWQQLDSVIRFEPHFAFSKNNKYRANNIYMTLRLPVGAKIYLDYSSEMVIHDVQNVQDMWDGDMIGRYWTMTDKGLSLTDKITPPIVIADTLISDTTLRDMKDELKKMQ